MYINCHLDPTTINRTEWESHLKALRLHHRKITKARQQSRHPDKPELFDLGLFAMSHVMGTLAAREVAFVADRFVEITEMVQSQRDKLMIAVLQDEAGDSGELH